MSGISKLAYGFMASKALFGALEIDVFGGLAAGPKTLAELSETGIAASLRCHAKQGGGGLFQPRAALRLDGAGRIDERAR